MNATYDLLMLVSTIVFALIAGCLFGYAFVIDKQIISLVLSIFGLSILVLWGLVTTSITVAKRRKDED